MQKSKRSFIWQAEAVVKCSRRFQQPKCSHDIGRDKIGGSVDRAIDVQFGRKIDDSRGPVSLQQTFNKRAIADVAVDKNVTW